MPTNSEFKINNFSPDFRDALLNRNLLADSIIDNSLTNLLDVINKPAAVENVRGPYVQPSPDIEVDGPSHMTNNISFNKIYNKADYYKKQPIPYTKTDIIFPDYDYNTYAVSPISSPTNDGVYWRESENTIFNLYKIGGKKYYTYKGSLVDYENFNVTTNTELVDNNIKHSPEQDGPFLRQSNVTQNRYEATDYERVSVELLPFAINSALLSLNLDAGQYGPIKNILLTYSEGGVRIPLTASDIGNIREFNTTKNIYLDTDKQTLIDLNNYPQPAEGVQQKSYLDENNNLNVGGPSTQLLDVIGSVLTGGGVGFDPNSGNAVPDFDVRGTLLGRGLAGAGKINDTRLGIISGHYLAAAIGNNIAFNLQEEIGEVVNTNITSLLSGGPLVLPNDKITVGAGGVGFATDIIERMTGAKVPVSLLPAEADIFSFDRKGFIGVPNIARANNMLANTGSGQIQALFGNINSNTNPALIGNRQGYAPFYLDGNNSNNTSNIYAYGDGDGGVKDILNRGPENSPVVQSSHDLSGVIHNSGFGAPAISGRDGKQRIPDDGSYSNFIWGDDETNKLTQEKSPFSTSLITNSTESKSILHRTQELFNSGNMRTLISGKGTRPISFDSETTTTKKGFMSKGSAVLKNGGIGLNGNESPDDIFVRAWSPVDSYNQYQDLQKYKGLTKDGRVDNVDTDASVLEDFGVKIAPNGSGDKIKKFMFSIENLAWDGETTKLLDCEKGPGDTLSGTKGRIMWFPPYDMVFNESTSVNWDRSNFIGRGEPVYTYNNTERTGNLSWKIVVDHPNYLNYMKGRSNDEIAAFFAGALSIEDVRNNLLSDDERAALEVSENNKQIEGVLSNKDLNINFSIFFPNANNDVASLLISGYEDGFKRDEDGAKIEPPQKINYGEDLEAFETNGTKTTVANANEGFGPSTTYVDNTNFGFNSTEVSMGDKTYPGWNGVADGKYAFLEDFIEQILVGDYKYCKIFITGYASEQGPLDVNKRLAEKRGTNVKDFIQSATNLPNKRFAKIQSEVLIGTGCSADSSTDSAECKESRQVNVLVEYDSSLELEDANRITVSDTNEPRSRPIIPISRFYSECDYFSAVDSETESFASQEISSKIKNFHPAFHAITPEGFNSRLTFLNQCTRQGPTTSGVNPDNLAFGRPPVCILRIGDFYNTKIIIESLTVDYEPLVWDLNPEGVGVQPMIANINISFAFIGGSSLKGPINRLQNAVSFNFFANTELYDPRAERIVETIVPDNSEDKSTGRIQEGKFPFPPLVSEEVRKFNEQAVIDAQAVADAEAKKIAEAEAEKARLAPLENDKAILSSLNINSYKNNGEFGGFGLEIVASAGDDVTDPVLTTTYSGELYITDSLTNEIILVGLLEAIPADDTSFNVQSISYPNGNTDETTFFLGSDPTSIGLVTFNLFDHPDFDRIMSLLEPCGTIKTRIFNDIESDYFEPCEGGDNVLTMKWTDGKGFQNSSNRVYNEENNGASL